MLKYFIEYKIDYCYLKINFKQSVFIFSFNNKTVFSLSLCIIPELDNSLHLNFQLTIKCNLEQIKKKLTVSIFVYKAFNFTFKSCLIVFFTIISKPVFIYFAKVEQKSDSVKK